MKYCHNLPVKLLFIFLLFTGSAIPLAAQQADPQIRLARVLEDNQQYEQALELYQNLHHKNPGNFEIISGIKQCSLALQKYEELISFYENIIKTNPANSVWKIDLAEVYYLNNQKQKALELWWAEIKKDPKNIAPYRLSAMAMINQRLYDEAIAVYGQALQQIEGQSNLYLDIGNLYKQQLQYGQAAEQYLNYFNSNPQQKQFLQRQILNLCDEPGQVPAVIQSLEKYLALHPQQNDVRETLAGLFLKEKDYEHAFTIYKTLDQKATRGKYLLNFAAEAYNNHAYEYAISAYQALQAGFPDSPYKIQSDFEMGRCHFALAQILQENSSTEKAGLAEMARAVSIFDTLATQPQKSNFYAPSLIYLGDIFYNFYFDLDRAALYYQSYIRSQPGNNTREQTILKLGDVFLCKNQLDRARETYQQISMNEFKPMASFKLAELVYFQGQIKEAQTRLNGLIPALPTSHALLNDLLSRQMLLQSYAQDSVALVTFARCELLIFQHKLSEAAGQLSELARENKPISALAGKRSARLLLRLGKTSAARELLNELMSSFADDPAKDETILLLALAEEQLQNYQQAVQLYQQLLSSYPNSLFVQQARENTRRLQNQLKKDQS
jgi:tetratricopeptide (TPR) repeat protein